jgi:hypothetical protein
MRRRKPEPGIPGFLFDMINRIYRISSTEPERIHLRVKLWWTGNTERRRKSKPEFNRDEGDKGDGGTLGPPFVIPDAAVLRSGIQPLGRDVVIP